jgi:hypothetical protein
VRRADKLTATGDPDVRAFDLEASFSLYLSLSSILDVDYRLYIT